jgi:hypothetical protein
VYLKLNKEKIPIKILNSHRNNEETKKAQEKKEVILLK